MKRKRKRKRTNKKSKRRKLNSDSSQLFSFSDGKLNVRALILSKINKKKLEKYHIERYYEGDELLKIIPIHRKTVSVVKPQQKDVWKIPYKTPFTIEEGVFDNILKESSDDIDYYPNVFGTTNIFKDPNACTQYFEKPNPKELPYWIPKHNIYFGKDLLSIKTPNPQPPNPQPPKTQLPNPKPQLPQFYPFKTQNIRVRDMNNVHSMVGDIITNLEKLDQYVVFESEKREFVVDNPKNRKRRFLKMLKNDCKTEYSIKVKRIVLKE